MSSQMTQSGMTFKKFCDVIIVVISVLVEMMSYSLADDVLLLLLLSILYFVYSIFFYVFMGYAVWVRQWLKPDV